MRLYRPVGQTELNLIISADYNSYPPRLPEQPIFYPVLNERYAREIAERWNKKFADSGYAGYVTTFEIDDDYISKFENYEGTNQQAQTVKGLLSTISRNNEDKENDDMKITELNFNGEEYEATGENITSIKNNMNMEKNYRIEFEKDSDTGLIFRAVINEK